MFDFNSCKVAHQLGWFWFPITRDHPIIEITGLPMPSRLQKAASGWALGAPTRLNAE
jgi:hypothetical protein